jgi:hypothetical protein
VEHGNSGHSTSENAPEVAEIVEPSVATGGNPQQAVPSAAIVSEAAQPANAASETGEPAFRFDGEAAPSTFVDVVEINELDHRLDSLGRREALEMILKIVSPGVDEHAANHGNSDAHHAIVPAPHDLLI